MDKYKFGEFIYQKRKLLGITQDELGRKLGVTNKAVSKWETGETLPEITMLELLARSLNISIDELLTQTDNQQIAKKNVRINKLLLVLVMILFVIEIATICAFTIKPNKKAIAIDSSNYEQYIMINPLYSFNLENQKLTISSTYSLNEEYLIESNISLTCNYKINLYYYKNDNSIGVITYYNRICLVEISESDQLPVVKEIVLEPKEVILEFKGLKTVEVVYEVTECQGNVK